MLDAIRKGGVPMQRIRPALRDLQRGLGIPHALASRKLYTDGAELLYDYAERHPDARAARAARRLVVIRGGRRVFAEVIEEYLRGFGYAISVALRSRVRRRLCQAVPARRYDPGYDRRKT